MAFRCKNLAPRRACAAGNESVGWRKTLLLLALTCCGSNAALAGDIQVAVASNFRAAMEALVRDFEEQSPHRVVLIFGSTGKQYAQIRNGAPFDAFFSADMERPQKLEVEGVAVANTRFTYAIGKLVLWSPRADYVDAEGAVLHTGDFRHLSIANPELAPYGLAAQQVLESMGLWESLTPRIVRGENIAQAFQFIESGNAELGFVAFAQISNPKRATNGSWWEVPESLHQPIEQQAVLLRDSRSARDLLEFVRSPQALVTIRVYGYNTP